MAINVFHDRDVLDRALARDVAARLAAAVAVRGRASLVVSGGRTPLGMLDHLSHQHLPWASITITLADERWVEPTHTDSNERLIRFHLLCNGSAAARFVPLKNEAATPEDGAAATAAALAGIPHPFDVVLLGMGVDGHTASLFPGAPTLAAALDPAAMTPCIAVRPPRAPHPRLSLTRRALLDSRAILLQVTGADKYEVIERARRPGPVEDLPIRAILHQDAVPVTIYWSP